VKVKKIIKDKVKVDYLFIEGSLNIDSKYFIKQINKGIENDNNNNFHTNVQGYMTSYKYFNNDKIFLKNIYPLFDYLDSLDNIKPYELTSSWGLKENFSHFTQPHDHLPYYLSGIIYLNNHNQNLIFPELNKKITPKLNSFIIFSSFLLHKTDRNITNMNKYAISFNLTKRIKENVH
tara:strand:+ start:7 stop:537 length:531 start_codon:yes stop_codon:yes gene_type:complete